MGIFTLYTCDICTMALGAVVKHSAVASWLFLRISLIIAVLRSEDGLTHFATFELPHADESPGDNERQCDRAFDERSATQRTGARLMETAAACVRFEC